MPIGISAGAATIGAAVLGAGATIYGSSQASHAQTEAAQTASNDQLAAAQQNDALAASIYNANAARLDPYSALGLPAGGEYNALLGIASPAAASPSTAPAPLPTVGPTGQPTTGSTYTGPSLDQIMAMQHDGIPGNYQAAMAAYQAAHSGAAAVPTVPPISMPNNAAAGLVAAGTGGEPGIVPHLPTGTPGGTAAPGTTPTGTPAPGTPGTSPNNAMAGFQTFYNSPTYQFPLSQGLKAVNTKYAAMGALESGAAMKAINDYAANNAAGALSTYMDQLYRQEALGEGASAALAGVGQNMVGQVSANNSSAASAAGDAALVAGQGSANTWNAFGSGMGQLAGTVAGALKSSYHPSNALGSFAPVDFSTMNLPPGTF